MNPWRPLAKFSQSGFEILSVTGFQGYSLEQQINVAMVINTFAKQYDLQSHLSFKVTKINSNIYVKDDFRNYFASFVKEQIKCAARILAQTKRVKDLYFAQE